MNFRKFAVLCMAVTIGLGAANAFPADGTITKIGKFVLCQIPLGLFSEDSDIRMELEQLRINRLTIQEEAETKRLQAKVEQENKRLEKRRQLQQQRLNLQWKAKQNRAQLRSQIQAQKVQLAAIKRQNLELKRQQEEQKNTVLPNYTPFMNYQGQNLAWMEIPQFKDEVLINLGTNPYPIFNKKTGQANFFYANPDYPSYKSPNGLYLWKSQWDNAIEQGYAPAIGNPNMNSPLRHEPRGIDICFNAHYNAYGNFADIHNLMFWTPSSMEHEYLQPQPGIISKTERILVNGLNKAYTGSKKALNGLWK